ncbi:hypothetical protein D8I24_7123 [Cupriavidus necator H850]|nr:hypothetical protein [Cupriavidus necator]KAI3596852.1 hypothetical protein D8I24_7123 [Cupriavidus necator H850]MDX6008962.1 hypothetical protein [Cupriavidus necator]
MRHPPSRMTARRRSYRLAGPPPSVVDLLSSPLLPHPRARTPPAAPAAQGAGCAATARQGVARTAFRRHAGKRRA